MTDTTNREVLVATTTTAINGLAIKLDQLAVKSKALKEPGESTKLGKVLVAHKAALDAIKKEAEATKKSITEQINLVDVFEAASIVTSVTASPTDADSATRQRMARRRAALKAILTKSYTDYDFRVDKIANRAVITPIKVGDAFTRKANEYMAILDEIKELGFEVPTIERNKIADILKSKAGLQKVYQDRPVQDNVPAVKDSVSDIESLMQDEPKIAEVQEETTAKPVKVAKK